MLQRAQALGWRPPAAEPSDNVIAMSRFRNGVRDRGHDGDAGFDRLLLDARLAVGRMVAQRSTRPIPPMRATRRHHPWFAAALVLAAAVVASLVGAGVVLHPGRAQAPSQAVHGELPGPAPHTAVPAAPPLSEPVRVRVPPRASAIAAPAEATPPPVVRAPARRASGRDLDALRRMSDEARALWRAGDRVGADRRFAQVIAQGGRSPLVELAWGDRFAIARQLGDEAGLLSRWGTYLRRFPRGRYADDARAGLCAAESDAARRPACWEAYLRDFPRGSYRGDASRR
ncbi:MAG: hypothetical protein U0168_29465 [Nannocystaceae bacterium]